MLLCTELGPLKTVCTYCILPLPGVLEFVLSEELKSADCIEAFESDVEIVSYSFEIKLKEVLTRLALELDVKVLQERICRSKELH